MNPTIQTILTRRSIRNYKSEQIPRDILQQIINAGLYAPSAMGRQPWHLVVVRGYENIVEVNEQVKAATARMPENPYRDYVAANSYTINYGAPTFMIVAGDCELSPRNAGFDCALLLGNMFLAAHSLGVGSCWINQLNVLNDELGFRDYMTKTGIPLQNRIFGCACFGYANGPARDAAPRKENNVVWIGE